MDNTPTLLLAPEDSKRVADALIAAIESVRADIINRHDDMCAQMATNHFHAIQPQQPAYRGW